MTENVELRATITGNANPFKSAVKGAETALGGLGNTAENQSDRAKNSARRAAEAYRALERRINPVVAQTQGYSAALKVLNRQFQAGKVDIDRHNTNLALLAQRYPLAQQSAERFTQTMRTSRFAAGNLMAQFQDIGVMMASGQSPFLLAVQQGSQINQVLLGMQSQGKSVMATLGAAFRQFLHPMQLVTFALIAGVAALGQWIGSTISARMSADDAATGLASYTDIVEEATQEIGNLADEQDRMNRGLRDTTELGLTRGIEEQLDVVSRLQEQYDMAQRTLAEGADAQLALLRAAESELARREELLTNLIEARDEAERREEAEEAIADQLEAQAEALQAVRDARNEISMNLQDDLRSMREQVQMQELILQYGEDSAQVAEARARAEARSRGYVGQAVEQYVALRMRVREGELANVALEAAMAAIDGVTTNRVQEQILAIARALNITTTAAEALLATLPGDRGPYIPEARGAPMSAQPDQLAIVGAMANGPEYTPDGRSAPISGQPQMGLGAFATAIGDPDSRRGGGGGRSNPFETEWEALRENFETQAEIQLEAYAEQQDILQEALDRRLITLEEYHQMAEELQNQHQDRMADIDVYRYGTGLQQAQQFFGDMADAFAQGNERMVQIGQAFGAAEALINAWRTFSQVMADPKLPWFAKIPTAVALLGSAMKAVTAIKGVGKGGSGPSSAGAVGGAGNAGSVTAGSEAPPQQRSLTLIGDRFNRQQAIAIAEFMNEGTDDGLVIRGRR